MSASFFTTATAAQVANADANANVHVDICNTRILG